MDPNKYDVNADTELNAGEYEGDTDQSILSMDPEQRAKLEEEWRNELAKTEEEIQTLRQVLAAKLKHSQDLKRKLGITVWKEFREDMEQGLKNIQETTAYVDVSGKVVEWNSALQSMPIYQKTSEAVKVASERTTSVFGSLGGSVARKLGEVKNSTAFKSFEEKVGTAVTSVKTKMGSRSNSTNSFEEALNSTERRSTLTSPTIPEEKPLS